MQDQLESIRAELEALPKPSGFQLVALGAVRTALDNLHWHAASIEAGHVIPVETPAE